MTLGYHCRRQCCTPPEPIAWTPSPKWAEWLATYAPEGNLDE